MMLPVKRQAASAGLDSLLRRLELGLHGLPLFACRLQTHAGMAQHETQHRKYHARICQKDPEC